MPARLSWCQRDALGIFGNALGQPDLPLPTAIVDLEHDGCFARWKVGVRVYEEKVRAHLVDRDGGPIDNETHLDQGGMCNESLPADARLYAPRHWSLELNYYCSRFGGEVGGNGFGFGGGGDGEFVFAEEGAGVEFAVVIGFASEVGPPLFAQ